jgi:ubiquinone/menaquinone biosynthesis C-methylase UbiE
MMTWAMSIMDLFKSPKQLLEKAHIKEGMVVIDYACGPGRYTLPAAELVGNKGKVYAVDIQPMAIAMVKQKATRQSVKNIEAVLAESFDTGIPDSSADIVLLIDAIFPIRDRKSLLQEIDRVLKPGGTLFMDPSHLSFTKAKNIVEETHFFRLVESDGRNMVWGKAG